MIHMELTHGVYASKWIAIRYAIALGRPNGDAPVGNQLRLRINTRLESTTVREVLVKVRK